MQDPYVVLGVPRDASSDDIKSAFRRLAQKLHPDRNPGDDQASQRFKDANAAYQILSDPAKRQVFDRFGTAGGGGSSSAGGVGSSPFENIDGLFGDILRGFGLKNEQRGDIKLEVSIAFEEAAHGVTKEITYERTENCPPCRGSGSKAGEPGDICSGCNGRGKVRFQQGILPIAVERSCSRCRGTGRIVVHPCETCGGAGLISKSRTIEVSIPAGIEHGATRLVERGGHATRPDRGPGDLELTIRVQPHTFFRRQSDDIVCSVPISFMQAALGGDVEVPTLEGRGRLRIPSGTQPGSVLRIRSKGIPHRGRSGRGDHLVEVQIEVPTQLTERQRKLLEELALELGEDVQPQQKSFMQKLKELFG